MTDYTSYSQQQTGIFSSLGWSRRKRFVIALIFLALLVAIITGVALTSKEAANQESLPSAPAAEVIITTQASKPSTIRVQPDQSVVWRNADMESRSIKLSGVNDAKPVFMATVGAGETYTYVFDTVGTFNYYDGENPSRLSGVIIVE